MNKKKKIIIGSLALLCCCAVALFAVMKLDVQENDTGEARMHILRFNVK